MEICFAKLPENAGEMQAMPEYRLDTPFHSAALFIAAICVYPRDRDASLAMIDILKGPKPLSAYDRQFIRDRMANKADYIGRAYLRGATPQNGYTPEVPYTVEVNENPYSYANEGYATLYIRTAGADSARGIQLRRKGQDWFVWEFGGILADIRKPVAEDPWA